MRMSSCLKEMPKLILMQCLFALWLPATATYPSMVSLFDEVAEGLEQFQADYNANVKDSIGNEIGSFQALTGGMSLPVAGRRISEVPETLKRKKAQIDSQTSSKKSPKNRRWTHFIQREMMVATTLIKSMDRDLLVRQLKEGCRAKQYAFARKILGYLILQDKMRGVRVNRRRMRGPRQKRVTGMIDEIRKLIDKDDFDNMMGMDRASLAFVIDTTGSMGDEIALVRKFVAEIVNISRNFPVDYILSPFNDDTDPISREHNGNPKQFFANETSSFLQALDALVAIGGGDCPEMAIHGMKGVFSHGFSDRSPMFVITDAGAKDTSISDDYQVMADLSKPVTNIFVSKSSVCISPEDIKFYRSLVQERRGIVFSFLSTSIDLIENGLIGAEPIPVYLNKRKRRSQNKDEFYFDIDDTIENMEVAVMSDAASDKIDLFNNAGLLTLEGKLESNGKGALYTIKKPTTGRYNLHVPSDSNTLVTTRGSGHENINFEFYFRLEARVGIRAQNVSSLYPVRGHPAFMIVTINGFERISSSSLKLFVVDNTDLSVLGKCVLEQHGKRPNRFLTTFKIPKGNFSLLLSGKTTKNIPFRRVSHVIKTKPYLVHVLSSPRGMQLSLTTSVPYIFAVHTYLHREIVDIKVSPRDAVIRQPRYATVIPGRASLFILRFKAGKAAKVGAMQHSIVRATGRISGLTAHAIVSHLVK